MKTFLYLLLLLTFLMPSGAQQLGKLVTHGIGRDTIPADTTIRRDTIPGRDSLMLDADSLHYADSLAMALEDSLLFPYGKPLVGTASFYSRKFEGRKTATGDVFFNAKLTGASNNFRLNTWVRVTNLKNNKSVIVRINDRMHARMKKKGRIIDLTRAAAQRLGFLQGGLVKVKVQPVKKGTKK